MSKFSISGCFLFGFCCAVFLCGVLATIAYTADNQRLIDNGYAHYDGKTGDFVFHEKVKP